MMSPRSVSPFRARNPNTRRLSFILALLSIMLLIHRLRPMEEGQITMLIEWVHSIRRAAQYYSYLDGADSDDQKEDINRVHLNRRQVQQSQPIAEMTAKDLERGLVLGDANKKAGGMKSWRKR